MCPVTNPIPGWESLIKRQGNIKWSAEYTIKCCEALKRGARSVLQSPLPIHCILPAKPSSKHQLLGGQHAQLICIPLFPHSALSSLQSDFCLPVSETTLQCLFFIVTPSGHFLPNIIWILYSTFMLLMVTFALTLLLWLSKCHLLLVLLPLLIVDTCHHLC